MLAPQEDREVRGRARADAPDRPGQQSPSSRALRARLAPRGGPGPSSGWGLPSEAWGHRWPSAEEAGGDREGRKVTKAWVQRDPGTDGMRWEAGRFLEGPPVSLLVPCMSVLFWRTASPPQDGRCYGTGAPQL